MNSLTLSTGRKIAFAEYGDPHGTPAFYFHGWPSSGIQGSLMHRDAEELGLRIISPDRPGLGRSEFQPNRMLLDWPPLLTDMADQLGIGKFHVFGVSGGGPYVLATAHAMPERLLSASVVCGAPPLHLMGTRELFWPYRFVLLVRQRLNFLMGTVFKVSALLSHQRPHQLPMRWLIGMLNPEDQRVMRNAADQQVVAEGFRQSVAQHVRHAQHDADLYLNEWGFDLREIQYPIHLWHGREDRNIPFPYAEKVAAMLPNVITHWTDHDGHYSLAIARGREIAEAALAPR